MDVFETHKFKNWQRNLIKNDIIINNIDEKFTRRSADGQVLFSTLMLDAMTPEGDKIPPICFLKGDIVCVLICLICIETDEKYLLLVSQRRIAEGNCTFEHPAGMVDENDTPLEVAVREVSEETGLVIDNQQLINLSPNKRLFPSPGTSDEAMYLYCCEIKMSKKEIDNFNNKKINSEDNYERITTFIYPFVEGHEKITNTNLLLLNYLYLIYVNDIHTLLKLTTQKIGSAR